MQTGYCLTCGSVSVPELAGDSLWCRDCGEFLADGMGGCNCEPGALADLARGAGISLADSGLEYSEWRAAMRRNRFGFGWRPGHRAGCSKLCTVDGCDRRQKARGLCWVHYGQWQQENR